MNSDDHVCMCHRVSLRKLRAFMRRETPAKASQMSECLGAGTGCGWCVPFLEELHRQAQAGVDEPDIPGVDPLDYAALRTEYRKTGQRLKPEVDASAAASEKGKRQAGTPAPLNQKGLLNAGAVGQASLPARDGFSASRRRLPHWRLDGATYFVTWRLRPNQRDLSERERSLVVEAIRFFDGERYDLKAYVVMNDHVHALVWPHEGCDLSALLHTWKSFTASRMQREAHRIGVVWQDESFDRIVRDEGEYFEKLGYILTNPERRWPEIGEYEWAGVGARPER